MMGIEGFRNQNKGIIKGYDAVIIPKQEELSWIPIPTTAKGLLSNREWYPQNCHRHSNRATKLREPDTRIGSVLRSRRI